MTRWEPECVMNREFTAEASRGASGPREAFLHPLRLANEGLRAGTNVLAGTMQGRDAVRGAALWCARG